MKGSRLIFATLVGLILAAIYPRNAAAQEDYDENSRLNTNIAFPVTLPVGGTSRLVKLGTGITTGAGYNFSPHHAFVGEFMWSWLYPTDESLAPLRATLQSNELNGHSNLFVLTGNYRFEMRGRRFGSYVIGGAGLYYRNSTLTRAVSPVAGTPCTPIWQWWGFTCASGTVTVNQVHSSYSSPAPGGNAGVGITFHVHNPRYRVYVEARYHYAPSSTFTTRMIPITTGIRF